MPGCLPAISVARAVAQLYEVFKYVGVYMCSYVVLQYNPPCWMLLQSRAYTTLVVLSASVALVVTCIL